MLWRRWPVAGAPPYFASAEEYDRTVRTLVDTGVILDAGTVHWDVRGSALDVIEDAAAATVS